LTAKKENKYLFIDFYATWCGPCKQLKKSFKDKEIGAYYNKNFINISIDGETKEGRELMYRYQIESYPTLLIVDFKGNVRTKSIGVLKFYILINFGKRIVPY
jgi:thioredoxin 1